MSVIKRFFSDEHGRVVIWQMPNAPLVAWLGLLLLAKILPSGDWRSVVSLFGSLALGIWALLELGWGESPFRRLIGLAVLVYVVATRL